VSRVGRRDCLPGHSRPPSGDLGKPQPDDLRFAGLDRQAVVRRDFRSFLFRIDGLFPTVDDVAVDAVFHVRRAAGDAEDPLRVGFIFSEEQ